MSIGGRRVSIGVHIVSVGGKNGKRRVSIGGLYWVLRGPYDNDLVGDGAK